MDKEKALKKLNISMDKLCTCSLKATAIQAVAGKGNANADIVFIGEAPGKKEDEQGEPFIGAAGKFLSEMLASVNLSREDIYITNIIKYRPPDNRDPLPEEVEDCWLWLSEQIALIDPLLIVPLGRHALERFVPGQKISEAHGKTFHREVSGLGERTYFALYHPAAALYNGSLRETLLIDFSKVPKLLEKMKREIRKEDSL